MTEKIEVKFGEWIEKGFHIYKDNLGLLLLVSLVSVAISLVTGGILAGPMMAGLAYITMALTDQKEPKPPAGDIFNGFNYFLPAFLFCIVWCLVMLVVTFVLGIVPCIGALLALFVNYSIGTAVMFGLYLIVDKKMGFWDASRESYEITKTNFWAFLGFFVVCTILAYLGTLLCLIGVIITLPIEFCIIAVAYRSIGNVCACTATPENPQVIPPSGN